MKFNSKNIFKFLNKKNVIEGLKIGTAVAVTEAIPAVIQGIAGKNEDGTPKLNMTGQVPNLVSGAIAAAVFAGYGKPQYSGAILLVKSIKLLNTVANPVVFKATGTPMILPSTKQSGVVTMEGVSDGNMETRKMKLPDGSFIDVVVNKSATDGMSDDFQSIPFEAGVSDYESDFRQLSDNYAGEPLNDNFSGNPLSDDFQSTPLSDNFASNPLSDEFDAIPLSDYTNGAMSDWRSFEKNVTSGRY